jgi:glycosyltransferase involved in cell wall biosynthesis
MGNVRKLKVCHFASVHTLSDTRVFHRECVSLSEQFGVTYIGIGSFTGKIEGVDLIGIKKPTNRLFRIFFVTWIVFWKAWKQNADLYHIHDAELIPLASLLRLVKGKPVIYDIHENTYEDILRKPWVPKMLRYILEICYRILEWISSKTMGTILVIAKPEFSTKFLPGKPTAIIQNFADINHLSPYQESNRADLAGNHIFYMGTLYDYYYDILPIIEAIDILKQQGIDTHFHFVGYIGESNKQRIIESDFYPKIKSQITFYGHLSMNDGYLISQQCKIGLCLKNQDEKILVSHERKFFEYMAVGLPIICCDSAIYSDIVEAYQIGNSIDISDARAVAGTIKTMLTNNDQLNDFARNGIKAATENFNWEKEKITLFNFYKEMLQTAG